jgi:2-dehydropantoate 2-reductase
MQGFERGWVIGAGAVGSVLAALLERSGRIKVGLVGSSVHWSAVRDGGLLIETGLPSPTRVALATQAPEALPDLDARDLALLTGKLTQLEAIAGRLRGRLERAGGIIALQNGLGIDEWAQSLLGRPVDRGLVHFGAHIPAPGRVRFFPGGLRLRPAPATAALAALLADSGLRCELAGDFRAAEWRKLATNCLANPLAALLGVANAQVGRSELDGVKRALLDEVRSVAAAEGVQLEFTVEDFNRTITGATAGNVPSMAMDIARGAPTEIDYINGAVVRRGQARGIATPMNAAIVELVAFLSRMRHGAAATRRRPWNS